jgi:hypothetical protein
MSNNYRLLLMLLVLVLLITGCKPGEDELSEADQVLTSVVLTVEAKLALTGTPTMTATSTATPEPTFTLSPSPSPTVTATTGSASNFSGGQSAGTKCDQGGFVADVTIPDGTALAPGVAFTKTWKLINNGTCAWTSEYQLAFYSGDQMNGPATKQLTADAVSPGETLEISVDLVAPSTAGNYIGYWILKNPSGDNFGVDAFNNPFYVEINVSGSSDATATVTETPDGAATATATATGKSPTNTPTATATTPPPQPDLVITVLEFNPASPTAGSSTQVRVQVTNQGNADAVGPFDVGWYALDTDATPACNWSVPQITAKGSSLLTCNYTYATAGTYNTKAVADIGDAVKESDESNNTKTASITVQ